MKMKTNEKAKAKKLYPIRAAGFFALAFLCIVYYLIILIYGGSHTSILWIWLAGAVLSGAVGAVFLTFGKLPLRYPPVLILFVLLAGLVCSFLCYEGLVAVAAAQDTPEGVECIVVLGAAVKGETPSRALRYRIDTALDYLRNNPDTVAVLSGGMGYGENISEAECMRRELTRAGIDESRLIIEDESRDTAENIKNTLAIIKDEYESIAVVTNNFHVYRALRLCENMTDMKVYGCSAPFPSVLLLHFAVREYVGMCHDTLRGNIN